MTFWEIWIVVATILVASLAVATFTASKRTNVIAMVTMANYAVLIWALALWGPRL